MSENPDVQPTLGFQRVLQRAVLHIQSSGKKEVTGLNVLVAIFGEKESHAVYLLGRHGVTRLDVVNYISHGISKVHDEEGREVTPETGEEDEEGGHKAGTQPARDLCLQPQPVGPRRQDRSAHRPRA